jgi:ketosteroid isomerase-like protein
MSENLDLVSSIYAATSRGDFSTAEWADPGIVVELIDGPSPGRWSGLAGLAEAFRAILDAWADFRIDVDEFRELAHGCVLVLDRYSGRAKASAIQLAQVKPRGVTVFDVREGKVTRMTIYWDRNTGLADLGLEE